ncbi:hypothetical protein ACEWY4_009574 [Coilia grayii]|uniref:Proheparin-binding EGF-like growth factor n=1 Tax=Coilia grayii TaxID=363190 RepID=A0ABD1K6W5_9TELE
METGFANNFFCFLVIFRLCSCASIYSRDTSRMGTDSSRSDRLTTFQVEIFASGGYENETDYRAAPTASEQTTIHPSALTAMNRTKNESNPCLDSHKNFCISGTCQYHMDLNSISCKCHPGFEGERCHSISMELIQQRKGYDLTTVIIPVVLSISCLGVFILLLVIRHQKKHKQHEECEEKNNLQMTPFLEL